MRRDRFLDALKGVVDPQEKRRRIGHVFIEVFRDEAQLDLRRSLPGPGDALSGRDRKRRRSPTGPPRRSRSTTTWAGCPAELGFELIEPLRDLFKDEVRRLGLELGLPDALVWRHPFPGPGLAVRCLGEVTAERLEILRQADAIFLRRAARRRSRAAGRPGVCRAPAGAGRGRHGGRPNLRERGRPARRRDRRLHDGRLVAAASRPARLAPRRGSPIRSKGSTASSTTSPASRPGTIEWE